ncbi:hypothetical protein BDR06DRAFT_1061555 [Suillus hirtellus]|nr:hypothetical protein BDR06DRAFT_1061555 [Suillus hirtellus]
MGNSQCMHGLKLAGGLSHAKIILIPGPCSIHFILDPMHLGKDQIILAGPPKKHPLGENLYRVTKVEYGINKIVEDVILSSTKKTWQFHSEIYAVHQAYYMEAVMHALSLPIHKEALPPWFLNLHHRGLHTLRTKLGLVGPEDPIYVPQMMQELTRPLYAGPSINQPFLQSLPAVLPVPAQEEPYSYTSDLTADSQFGLYYCAPPDEDEGPQDPLNQGYSFY